MNVWILPASIVSISDQLHSVSALNSQLLWSASVMVSNHHVLAWRLKHKICQQPENSTDGSPNWAATTHQFLPSLILRIRVHGVLGARVSVVFFRRIHRQRCLGEALRKTGWVKPKRHLVYGEEDKGKGSGAPQKWKKRLALCQNLVQCFVFCFH